MTKRVHLTLSTNYVPDWGMKEGLRELIQNWLDAGGKGIPQYCDGSLVLENDGVIPRAALLVGHTTKAGVEAMRGEFGEGLKLGTMALLRDGCNVTIETQDATWRACFDAHPELGEQVLAWDIEDSDHQDERTCIRVDGLTGDDYGQVRRMFRWNSDHTKTHIIRDPALRGAVYVKGIHVCDNDRLSFGYDFHDMATDRDRKLVDNFSLASAAVRALVNGCKDGTVAGSELLDAMMNTHSLESDGALSYILRPTAQQLTDAWTAKHSDAIPCRERGDADALRSAGKKVVMIPTHMNNVMQLEYGDVAVERLVEGVVEGELTSTQKTNLEWVLSVVNSNSTDTLKVRPVQFMDRTISVARSRKDAGTLRVAQHILDDKPMLLAVVLDNVRYSKVHTMAAVLKSLMGAVEEKLDELPS